MKNVKILLLLGVMLVNVMPYINNGKVEWKAAQAEAQNYTCESNFFTLTWLTGNHKCVNTQNQTDWFWGATHDCIKQNTQCICSSCHFLFTCNGSDTKCPDCLADINDDESDETENSSNSENNSEGGNTTETGSNAGGSNNTSGGGTTGTGGNNASSGATTEWSNVNLSKTPCLLDLYPTYVHEVNGFNRTYACIFMVLESLTGKSAQQESQLHPEGIIDSISNVDKDYSYTYYYYLTLSGVNLSKNGPKSKNELIELMKNCDKGVLLCYDTGNLTSTGIHIAHIIIVSGLKKRDGDIYALVYNSQTPCTDGSIISGEESIESLCLESRCSWVIN